MRFRTCGKGYYLYLKLRHGLEIGRTACSTSTCRLGRRTQYHYTQSIYHSRRTMINHTRPTYLLPPHFVQSVQERPINIHKTLPEVDLPPPGSTLDSLYGGCCQHYTTHHHQHLAPSWTKQGLKQTNDLRSQSLWLTPITRYLSLFTTTLSLRYFLYGVIRAFAMWWILHSEWAKSFGTNIQIQRRPSYRG